MSFKRLEADDFVVSSEAISSTCWTTDAPQLTTFFTSSTQANGSSGTYYLNVFDSATTSSVQFAIAYGNAAGSGSAVYNTAVNGLSPYDSFFGISSTTGNGWSMAKVSTQAPSGASYGVLRRVTEYCQWEETRHSQQKKVGQHPDQCVSKFFEIILF